MRTNIDSKIEKTPHGGEIPRFFTPTNSTLLFFLLLLFLLKHSRVSHSNASGQWLVLWNTRPPCHHDWKPFRRIRSDSCLARQGAHLCALFLHVVVSFFFFFLLPQHGSLANKDVLESRAHIETPTRRHNRIRGPLVVVHLRCPKSSNVKSDLSSWGKN